MKDIFNKELSVGDYVLYARKRSGTANGELAQCVITKIDEVKKTISLKYLHPGFQSNYLSSSPHDQLVKITDKELINLMINEQSY